MSFIGTIKKLSRKENFMRLCHKNPKGKTIKTSKQIAFNNRLI